MKIKLLVSGLIVLFLLLGGTVLVKQSNTSFNVQPSAAWVEVIQPTALATRSNGSARELASGDEIMVGETIEVFEGGNANLYFPDSSVVRVHSSTKLTIDESLFEESSQKTAVRLRLLVGKAWFKILSLVTQDSVWEVKTANAVATVRGTAFGVEHREGKSSIVTMENKVAVAPIDSATGEVLKEATVEVREKELVELKEETVAAVKAQLAATREESKEQLAAVASTIIAVKTITAEKLKEDWIQKSLAADQKIEQKLERVLEKVENIKETRKEILEAFREIKAGIKAMPEAVSPERKLAEPTKPELVVPLKKPEILREPTKPQPETDEKLRESAVTSESPPKTSSNSKPQSLKIATKSNLSDVLEKTAIQFSAIVLMNDGTQKDVTSEAEWKVIGPIGRFTDKPGVFLAALTDEVAEQGEAFGAAVATWKDPASNEAFLGKSDIFKVSAFFEETLDERG